MSDKKISFTWVAKLTNLSVLACFAGLLWLVCRVFDFDTIVLILGITIVSVVPFLQVWIMPGLNFRSEVLKIRELLGSTCRIPYSKIVSVQAKTISGKPRIVIEYKAARADRSERIKYLVALDWYTISTDEFIERIQVKIKSA